MRKLIPVFVILALLIGGFFALRAYLGQQSAMAMSNLQTVAAGRGELVASVGATGSVRANQTTVLAWQTTGIVEQVQANVGDQIKTNQEIANLKQTSLPQNMILARADLVNAQKTLDDLLISQLASARRSRP
jgi:HlyD family secretion protein